MFASVFEYFYRGKKKKSYFLSISTDIVQDSHLAKAIEGDLNDQAIPDLYIFSQTSLKKKNKCLWVPQNH